MNILFNVTFI